MHNWRILDVVYLYDGSIEGFFTIVNICFKEKKVPADIKTEDSFIPDLLTKTIYINTDLDLSKEIFEKIAKVSDYTLYNTFTTFLSFNENKEIILFKYLIYNFKYGYKANFFKDNEWVINIDKIVRQVKGEAHRLSGFVRFRELKSKILYSEIEPDNDVIELLAKHFSLRLSSISWIINDKKRNIAAVYNKEKFIIVDTSNINEDMLEDSNSEKAYEDMWKMFYKTIAIKERTNNRCRLNFMPKRYWKYMLEVSEEI